MPKITRLTKDLRIYRVHKNNHALIQCNADSLFILVQVLTSGTVGAVCECGQLRGVGERALGTLQGFCGLRGAVVTGRALVSICSLIGCA